jgi:hypothetical protein
MKSPAWQKINDENLKNYPEFLNDPLDVLLERMNYVNPNVDTLNNDLVKILKYTSSTTIPHCGYAKQEISYTSMIVYVGCSPVLFLLLLVNDQTCYLLTLPRVFRTILAD